MIDFRAMDSRLREELRTDLYAKGISVTELAAELGLSRVQLSRILNGHSDTTFETWAKIAAKAGKRFTLEPL